MTELLHFLILGFACVLAVVPFAVAVEMGYRDGIEQARAEHVDAANRCK
jgi:hypothetical protein